MSVDAVTVIITRRVHPGREQAYEAWLHGVGEVASGFPGHLGMTVIRPRAGSRDYTFMFRFDTHDRLRAWDESEVRREWLARADELTGPAQREDAHGIEAWFALPEAGSPRPPPKWKMAIVSWLVAFPTIQLLTAVVAPQLTMVPALVRGALIGAGMIVFMTYAAMPAATRAFASWLFPRRA